MTRDLAVIIGTRLRDLRSRRGMSQAYVAEVMTAIGCAWTQQRVSEIEDGARELLAIEVCFLAAVFGLAPTEILPDPKGDAA